MAMAPSTFLSVTMTIQGQHPRPFVVANDVDGPAFCLKAPRE